MAGNAALHVGGTASIDAAVLDGGGPRVVAPAFATANRNDVGVPVQEQWTPPARALQRCNDVRASFIASVHGYIGWMLLQRFPIRFPHVDIEADLSHVVGEKLLDLRFIPGDAGDGDHLLQKSDRFFTAVVDLLHKCLVETRTHLRSPKNPVAGASLSGDFTSVNPRPSTSQSRDKSSRATPLRDGPDDAVWRDRRHQ